MILNKLKNFIVLLNKFEEIYLKYEIYYSRKIKIRNEIRTLI